MIFSLENGTNLRNANSNRFCESGHLKKFYEGSCEKKVTRMMTACVSVKSKAVWNDTESLVSTVTFALERIGHDTGPSDGQTHAGHLQRHESTH